MESKPDSDIIEGDIIIPLKYAYNRALRREFPYFDEREDAILVQRLNSDERIWSPKSAWEFNYKPSESPLIIEVAPQQLFKVRVRDEDVYWEFKVTEEELAMLNEGRLEVFWNQGWIQKDPEHQKEKSVIKEWEKRREQLKMMFVGLMEMKKEEHRFRKRIRKVIKQEDKRVSHRGWCLVNRKQRDLLLNRVNYSDHYQQLVNEGGSEAWSEWSSIRWLKHGPTWREYKKITRTPLRKSQNAVSIELKSDHAQSDSQEGEAYRPKFIKRFKKR